MSHLKYWSFPDEGELAKQDWFEAPHFPPDKENHTIRLQHVSSSVPLAVFSCFGFHTSTSTTRCLDVLNLLCRWVASPPLVVSVLLQSPSATSQYPQYTRVWDVLCNSKLQIFCPSKSGHNVGAPWGPNSLLVPKPDGISPWNQHTHARTHTNTLRFLVVVNTQTCLSGEKRKHLQMSQNNGWVL